MLTAKWACFMIDSTYITLLQTEAHIHIYFISFIFNNSANIVIPAVKNASS